MSLAYREQEEESNERDITEIYRTTEPNSWKYSNLEEYITEYTKYVSFVEQKWHNRDSHIDANNQLVILCPLCNYPAKLSLLSHPDEPWYECLNPNTGPVGWVGETSRYIRPE